MNLFAGDPNGGGAGRKAIIAQCEESLRRLQTDYIDLYYLHNWDRFTPIEETMSALDDLVRSGKVRYIGFSDAPAWKVAQAQTMAHFRGRSPLIALQIEYSLMERTVEGELVPMAEELGLGVLPWGPLKSGALTGKYTRANGAKMQGLRDAARRRVHREAVRHHRCCRQNCGGVRDQFFCGGACVVEGRNGGALYDYPRPNT